MPNYLNPELNSILLLIHASSQAYHWNCDNPQNKSNFIKKNGHSTKIKCLKTFCKLLTRSGLCLFLARKLLNSSHCSKRDLFKGIDAVISRNRIPKEIEIISTCVKFLDIVPSSRIIDSIQSIASHPTYPIIATGSESGKLKIFSKNVDGIYEFIASWNSIPQTCILCMAFHHSKLILAIGIVGSLKFFKISPDTKEVECVMTLVLDESPVYSVKFDWKGDHIAVGYGQKSAKIFRRLPNNTYIDVMDLNGHSDKVFCIDFHKNKPLIALGSSDKTATVWNTSLKETRHTILRGHTTAISSILFNMNLVITGSYNDLRLWNTETKCIIRIECNLNCSILQLSSYACGIHNFLLMSGDKRNDILLWNLSNDSSLTNRTILPKENTGYGEVVRLLFDCDGSVVKTQGDELQLIENSCKMDINLF